MLTVKARTGNSDLKFRIPLLISPAGITRSYSHMLAANNIRRYNNEINSTVANVELDEWKGEKILLKIFSYCLVHNFRTAWFKIKLQHVKHTYNINGWMFFESCWFWLFIFVIILKNKYEIKIITFKQKNKKRLNS